MHTTNGTQRHEDRWEEFQRRYQDELKGNPDTWRPILDASREGTVTLLYSAHDELHNGALVLRDHLTKHGKSRASAGRANRRRGPSRP